MDTLFRKYQWVLRLAAIAASVTLAAVIVNHLAASYLAPLTVPKLPGYQAENGNGNDGGDPTNAAANPGAWADKLTDRCYFGCTDQSDQPKRCPDGCDDGEKCQDGVCVPVEPEQTGPESDVPVESDLNVKLLGCMVADNSDYSLAMVQDGNSQQTYVVSPGDYLPEDSEVVEIKRDRIFIRRNGQLEFIRLEKTIGGDPSPTSVNTRSMSGSNPARMKLQAGSGRGNGGSADSSNLVRETSGDKFVVSKKAVEKATDNPEEIAQDARVISNFQDGERQGVKLVGVAPSGLYSKLGFQTGDVLHSVDGEQLRSESDAREFIDQLQEGDNVEVVVERDGDEVERQFVVE